MVDDPADDDLSRPPRRRPAHRSPPERSLGGRVKRLSSRSNTGAGVGAAPGPKVMEKRGLGRQVADQPGPLRTVGARQRFGLPAVEAVHPRAASAADVSGGRGIKSPIARVRPALRVDRDGDRQPARSVRPRRGIAFDHGDLASFHTAVAARCLLRGDRPIGPAPGSARPCRTGGAMPRIRQQGTAPPPPESPGPARQVNAIPGAGIAVNGTSAAVCDPNGRPSEIDDAVGNCRGRRSGEPSSRGDAPPPRSGRRADSDRGGGPRSIRSTRPRWPTWSRLAMLATTTRSSGSARAAQIASVPPPRPPSPAAPPASPSARGSRPVARPSRPVEPVEEEGGRGGNLQLFPRCASRAMP